MPEPVADFPGRPIRPTNNACERDLRPAVINRKVNNGFRSPGPHMPTLPYAPWIPDALQAQDPFRPFSDHGLKQLRQGVGNYIGGLESGDLEKVIPGRFPEHNYRIGANAWIVATGEALPSVVSDMVGFSVEGGNVTAISRPSQRSGGGDGTNGSGERLARIEARMENMATKEDIATLKAEIEKTGSTNLKWLLGTMITFVIAAVALMNFLSSAA